MQVGRVQESGRRKRKDVRRVSREKRLHIQKNRDDRSRREKASYTVLRETRMRGKDGSGRKNR